MNFLPYKDHKDVSSQIEEYGYQVRISETKGHLFYELIESGNPEPIGTAGTLPQLLNLIRVELGNRIYGKAFMATRLTATNRAYDEYRDKDED